MDPDDNACPQCGQSNDPDANFCSVCGAALPHDDAHTETHLVLDTQGEDLPMVVVVRGANAGSRYALTGDLTTIGRHPESAVFLDDVTVSRRHAEIRRVESGLELIDVGSLNGTYVNGDRIERTTLDAGDQLQIGKYRLVLVLGCTGVED